MRSLVLFLLAVMLCGAAGDRALAQANPRLIEGMTHYLATDFERAAAVLIPLAEAGDPDARYLMTFDPSALRSTAVFQVWAAAKGDPSLADGVVRGWIVQAAGQDHPGAIALLFRSQIDMPTRIRWGERGAELGMADAQEWLATVRFGFFGEAFKDPAQAVDLIERAVGQGNNDALVFYGYHLSQGELVARDYPRGLDLLRQAADTGDTDAVAVLAKFLAADLGPDPQPVEALSYFYLNFDRSGGETSGEAIAKLEAELSPADRRAARQAADFWWVEHLADRTSAQGRAAAWLARTYSNRHWEPWEIAFIAKTVECPVPRLETIHFDDYGASAVYARCMEQGLEAFEMPR